MTKKKESLSTEERLKNALVPDWEQPYKVPVNWVWTKVNAVAEIVMGQSPNGADTTEQISEYGLIGGAADMGELIPKISRYTVSPTKLSQKNDVILSIRATLGRPIFSDGIYCLGRGVSAIRSKKLSKEFLRYFYLNFEQYLYDVATGTTFTQVGSEQLKSMKIPLPPLAEQQRIVNRIESLLYKLDEAKEKVQAALGSFENRKSAILHKAFTGELTKKWREENGVSLDSWEEKTIDEVCKIRAGHAFDSKKFADNGHQVIRMGNLYNGVLDLERNPVFMPVEEVDKKSLKKATINKGDILLTLTGTKYKRDYGYAVMVEIGGLLLNQRIVAMTPTTINPKYLLFTLQSNYFRDIFFSNETGGVNQGNVSSKFVEQIKIKYPSATEQAEIVRILDSVFEKEQKAKELADVIEKIDLMRKAILARAFRGELGTNDPNEESAMELLEQILEAKG